MAISKITRNYQITLPRSVRENVHLDIGDTLHIITDGDQIILTKKNVDVIEKTFGTWKKVTGSSVDYVRKMRKDSSKRQRRLGL